MKKRVVRARPVESGDGAWGEGLWLVELPSSPPRVITAMVGPFGDKDGKEPWVAKAYDRVLQVHLGGNAPSYQESLYSVVQGYLDRTSGHWPRLAWDRDPRVPVDPAELDPLPPEVTETAYVEPAPPAEAAPAPVTPSPLDTPWTPPPPAHAAPAPRRRGRKAG